MEQEYNEKKCVQCKSINNHLKLPAKVCKECVELLVLYYQKPDFDFLKKCSLCENRYPFLNHVCNSCVAVPIAD